MRPAIRLALAVIAFAATQPLHAQQTTLTVGLGPSMPSDAALKTGFNGAIGLHVKQPLAPIGISIEGVLNSFPVDGSDATQRSIAIVGNLTFSTTALPRLYLTGGAGLYSTKITGVSQPQDANEDIGVNVGAGVNIPLASFGLFAEVRFHHVMSEVEAFRFVPLTLGVRF